MIVLGLTVMGRIVDTIVNRHDLLAVRPHRIHDVDAFYWAMVFARVLLFDEGDRSSVGLVEHAVIDRELAAVSVNQMLALSPQNFWCQLLLREPATHRIVRHRIRRDF